MNPEIIQIKAFDRERYLKKPISTFTYDSLVDLVLDVTVFNSLNSKLKEDISIFLQYQRIGTYEKEVELSLLKKARLDLLSPLNRG